MSVISPGFFLANGFVKHTITIDKNKFFTILETTERIILEIIVLY
jgi:hypothetical protein